MLELSITSGRANGKTIYGGRGDIHFRVSVTGLVGSGQHRTWVMSEEDPTITPRMIMTNGKYNIHENQIYIIIYTETDT